jgi:hypothetical protein
MSNDNERSVASAGSQPVAWAVEFDGEVEPFCLSFDKGKAIDEAGGVGLVVPLYRSPTLTNEEREALLFCYRAALPEAEKLGGNAGELCRIHPDTLRGLLERLG